MSITPSTTQIWARWRHSVRSPLNQIIGYSELLLETMARDAQPDLWALIAEGRQSCGVMLDRLKSTQMPADVGQALETIRATGEEMLLPFETLEWVILQAREMLQTSSDVTLVADLARMQESVGRLRIMLESSPAQFPEDEGDGIMPEIAALGPIGGTFTGSPFENEGAVLMVVDDDRINREVLGRRLEKMGFAVIKTSGGREAMARLEVDHVDLVMLDILMPEWDGFQTLAKIKALPEGNFLPVIMLTALDDAASIAHCLARGADDYVPKPFDATVLRARINSALDRKRLREREREYLARIRREMAKSEMLLHNILPVSIAARLKEGERQIVDTVPVATVLFADIVGFTKIAMTLSAGRTVELLSRLFSAFDAEVERLGLEKIKTIGDAYMAVAGVPEPKSDHAARAARMALAMMQVVQRFNAAEGIDWSLRIGMHSGEVMAGIIGTEKFAYDLWGDTVNIASRLESHGSAGSITLSTHTAALLEDAFVLSPQGNLDLRNRGTMAVVRLHGERG